MNYLAEFSQTFFDWLPFILGPRPLENLFSAIHIVLVIHICNCLHFQLKRIITRMVFYNFLIFNIFFPTAYNFNLALQQYPTLFQLRTSFYTCLVNWGFNRRIQT